LYSKAWLTASSRLSSFSAGFKALILVTERKRLIVKNNAKKRFLSKKVPLIINITYKLKNKQAVWVTDF
jgi:hypothetical protein